MRVNKEILKQLPPEYQALWNASKNVPFKDTEIRRLLQKQVQRARMKYLTTINEDRLENKLANFGNDGGWSLHTVQQLSKELFEDKRPLMVDLGNWLSVELELIIPSKKAETTFVSFVRKLGLSNSVTIKDDHSIKLQKCECEESYDEDLDEHVIDHTDDCVADAKNAFGREIVVTFKYGEWETLKSICGKLNALGCKVNKSCGLHVHFDMRHIDNQHKVTTIAQRVARVVPALKQMLPASRRDNEYCEKVINKHSDPDDSRFARYAFVNVKSYDRHQTLEIRGHSGTTDANKIINWIRILRTVMNKPNRKELVTVQEMLERFKLEPDLQAYMLARQEKFKNIGSSRVDDVSNDNQAVESGQGELTTQEFVQGVHRRINQEVDRMVFGNTFAGRLFHVPEQGAYNYIVTAVPDTTPEVNESLEQNDEVA